MTRVSNRRVFVREELTDKDWKIANLRRQAKVSYPTAHLAAQNGWPTGRITLDTIRAIAKALGVATVDLLPDEDFISQV